MLTAGKEKKNIGNLEAPTRRPEEYILFQIVYIYMEGYLGQDLRDDTSGPEHLVVKSVAC